MPGQPGEISRRRVLAGVAWTTPAIVLAVSVPRAAASDGDILVGNYTEFTYHQISNGTNGTVNAGFEYQVIVGAPPLPNGAVLSTHWTVSIVSGPTTRPPLTGSADVPLYGHSDNFSRDFTGLSAGTYTVRVEVSADPYVDTETGDTYVPTTIRFTDSINVTV